jgi:Mg2+ and Co2+ transporter CorA
VAIDPSTGLSWQNDMHAEFQPRPTFHNYASVPFLPSVSLYHEMIKFYRNLTTKEACIIREDSFKAIHHILRFTAAEWMNIGHIIDCELTKLDYVEENVLLGFHSLQQEVKVLHMWRRRCARYGEISRRSEELCSHRGPLQWPRLGQCESTPLIIEDFQAIHEKFKQMETKAEKQISTVLAKISAEAGEKTIYEARRVTRLSIIATAFLPLSFVASVFGMNGPFAVDGDRWWIYIVVASPLTLSIILYGRCFRERAQEEPALSIHHDHFDTEHLRRAGLSY